MSARRRAVSKQAEEEVAQFASKSLRSCPLFQCAILEAICPAVSQAPFPPAFSHKHPVKKKASQEPILVRSIEPLEPVTGTSDKLLANGAIQEPFLGSESPEDAGLTRFSSLSNWLLCYHNCIAAYTFVVQFLVRCILDRPRRREQKSRERARAAQAERCRLMAREALSPFLSETPCSSNTPQ